MWAWGPHPCGPQSQKEIANHVVWTTCTIKWDSSGSDPIFQKYVGKIGRFPENMANSPMNLPEKFKKMAILAGYFITAIW
jgi:hypothetical protein